MYGGSQPLAILVQEACTPSSNFCGRQSSQTHQFKISSTEWDELEKRLVIVRNVGGKRTVTIYEVTMGPLHWDCLYTRWWCLSHAFALIELDMFMHMKMMISAYTLENASVPILQDRPSVILNAKTGEGIGLGEERMERSCVVSYNCLGMNVQWLNSKNWTTELHFYYHLNKLS